MFGHRIVEYVKIHLNSFRGGHWARAYYKHISLPAAMVAFVLIYFHRYIPADIMQIQKYILKMNWSTVGFRAFHFNGQILPSISNIFPCHCCSCFWCAVAAAHRNSNQSEQTILCRTICMRFEVLEPDDVWRKWGAHLILSNSNFVTFISSDANIWEL